MDHHPQKNAFTLAPGEEQVLCPYDVSHLVRINRLKIHLERCRRNYLMKLRGTAIPMEYCRYNEYHSYPAIEIKCHEQYCPQKIQMEVQEDRVGKPEVPADPEPSGVDWNTFDGSDKEFDVMDHVNKVFVPPVDDISYDPEEESFWKSNSTRAPGRMIDRPPVGLGDKSVRFVNQGRAKADKKAARSFDREDYERMLQACKISGKLHFEPKFEMDGKNMVDPELRDLVDDISEGGADGSGYESDTETVYEDACSHVGEVGDLERDFEKFKIQPGPSSRFGSMSSLATCSDFDDYQSCVDDED